MDKIYKVAIIGCGNIGALKDDKYDYPGGENILTHAHAVCAYPKTELVALIDPNMNKALAADRKWGNTKFNLALSSIRELSTYDIHPDIFIVATPPDTHYQVLLRILEEKPRLVIAEKPFCDNIQDAIKVNHAYKTAQIPIIVDYSRRFIPDILAILIELRDGHYGRICHAECLYGRGFRRDGCHAVDILNTVFGIPTHVEFENIVYDYLPDDPTVTVHMKYENCENVSMIATDSRDYGIFEFEFITQKGIVHLHDYCKEIQIYTPYQGTTHGNYMIMNRYSSQNKTVSLTKALFNVIDNAVNVLSGHSKPYCTAEDALYVHTVLDKSPYKPIQKEGI